MALVKLNNRGVRSATTFGSISALGSMTFIKKQTASSSSTISFVDGTSDVVLDDTYKEYIFTFNNIHAQTHGEQFTFNMSIDSGSNYNVAKTSTFFYAREEETGSSGSLAYRAAHDLAQGTGFQPIMDDVDITSYSGSGSGAGILKIYNPSDTTFVKHFISRTHNLRDNTFASSNHCAGYGNTTSAVDAIQFKMSSGNIDAGDICLYGIN